MDYFPQLLFLAVLFAMFISFRPKQFAIAICALALLAIMAAGHFFHGVALSWFAIAVNAVALVALMAIAHRLHPKDQPFFRIMALMVWASIACTWGYLQDYISLGAHLEWMQIIALVHAAIMLGGTDGIQYAGSIGRRFRRGRAGVGTEGSVQR